MRISESESPALIGGRKYLIFATNITHPQFVPSVDNSLEDGEFEGAFEEAAKDALDAHDAQAEYYEGRDQPCGQWHSNDDARDCQGCRDEADIERGEARRDEGER